MLIVNISSKHKDIENLHIRNDNLQDEKQRLVSKNKQLTRKYDDAKDEMLLKEQKIGTTEFIKHFIKRFVRPSLNEKIEKQKQDTKKQWNSSNKKIEKYKSEISKSEKDIQRSFKKK